MDDRFNISLNQSDNLSVNFMPSGTDDYDSLRNKPMIEGVTLEGNKTFEELHMNRLTNIEIENILQ